MNTKPMGGLLRARRSMSYMAFLPLLLFCLRDCADSADFDLQKRMVLFSYGSVRTRSTKRLDYPVWKQTDNFAQKKNRTKAPPGRWQLARTQPSSVYANTESARATSASRGKTRHAVSKRKHRPPSLTCAVLVVTTWDDPKSERAPCLPSADRSASRVAPLGFAQPKGSIFLCCGCLCHNRGEQASSLALLKLIRLLAGGVFATWRP